MFHFQLDEKLTNNLISLTSGTGAPVKNHVTNHMGGTEDMEMCSDEDDEYNPRHHQQQQRHHSVTSQHHVTSQKPPPLPQHNLPPPEFAKNGTTPVCPAEVGHRSNSVSAIANIAYRLGRPLTWNPEKEKFKKDKEANELLLPRFREGWKL